MNGVLRLSLHFDVAELCGRIKLDPGHDIVPTSAGACETFHDGRAGSRAQQNCATYVRGGIRIDMDDLKRRVDGHAWLQRQ